MLANRPTVQNILRIHASFDVKMMAVKGQQRPRELGHRNLILSNGCIYANENEKNNPIATNLQPHKKKQQQQKNKTTTSDYD